MLKKWFVLFSCTDLFDLKQPKLNFPLEDKGNTLVNHKVFADLTHRSFAEFLGCGLNESVFEAVILSLYIGRTEGLDMARCQWRRDFPHRNQRDLAILAGAETLHSAPNVFYRLVQHFKEIWFWMGIKFGSETEALSEPEQPISTGEVWDRCDLIAGIS